MLICGIVIPAFSLKMKRCVGFISWSWWDHSVHHLATKKVSSNFFFIKFAFCNCYLYVTIITSNRILWLLAFSSLSGDSFEHVASILVNISQKEAGRKLLLDPKRGLLKQIIRQFDSPSPLRKKGVFVFISPCPFSTIKYKTFYVSQMPLLGQILWGTI